MFSHYIGKNGNISVPVFYDKILVKKLRIGKWKNKVKTGKKRDILTISFVFHNAAGIFLVNVNDSFIF